MSQFRSKREILYFLRCRRCRRRHRHCIRKGVTRGRWKNAPHSPRRKAFALLLASAAAEPSVCVFACCTFFFVYAKMFVLGKIWSRKWAAVTWQWGGGRLRSTSKTNRPKRDMQLPDGMHAAAHRNCRVLRRTWKFVGRWWGKCALPSEQDRSKRGGEK